MPAASWPAAISACAITPDADVIAIRPCPSSFSADHFVQRVVTISCVRPHIRRPASRVDRLRECGTGEHIRALELKNACVAGITLRIDGLGLTAHRNAKGVELKARCRNDARYLRQKR